MSNLRVDGAHGLALEKRCNPARVLVAQAGDEHGVKTIQVPAEVPEARTTAEATVDQHVEAVDAKESRVPLASGEDVERGVTEADVAHHVRGRKALLDGLGDHERGHVGEEAVDRRLGLDDLTGIEADLERFGASQDLELLGS